MVSCIGEVTIYVSNLGRSKSFYTEALGFRVLREEEGKNFLVVGPEGSAMGIHLIQPDTEWRLDYESMWAKMGTETGIVLYCDDLDGLVKILKENGLEFNEDVKEDRFGRRIAAVYDPDYNQLSLMEQP